MAHCSTVTRKAAAIDNRRHLVPCHLERQGRLEVDSTIEQCTMPEDAEEGSTIDLVRILNSEVEARILRKDKVLLASGEALMEEGEDLMEEEGIMMNKVGLSVVEVETLKKEVGTLTEGAETSKEDGALKQEEGGPKDVAMSQDQVSMTLRDERGV
jgi:hypothetical protein